MFVFGAVVTVVVLHVAAADVRVVFAMVLQSAVVVAAAVVPCVVAAAAAELAVAVSAVEMFEIGVFVVHDVAAAAAAAEPQVLPTAFARGHCFVGD